MADLDPRTLFDVKGLVAVITGGGTGIGLMLAQALEANGTVVYILGRRLEVLEQAAKTAKHANIHAIKADVTSKTDLAAAAEHISQKSGYVNLVIANSGITGPTLMGLSESASLTEFRDHLDSWSVDEYNKTYEVNTTAVFLTLVAFLELLDKGNKAGNVEQTSQFVAVSSAGAFNRVPMAGYAYSGSKAATVHIVKQFATRLVPFDIRANIIAPGLYPSEISASLLQKNHGDVFPREFVPARRAGDVRDMAGAILFLASRAGGYINGNVLLTDGGRLSIQPGTY
ncbi:NAD(P)-binding protein [Ophiobolus disseminans]|uniref:NAD(P)-binding protein n=1 Tax=Ophiobolus disseminans TaxID=1469910 RepID=A0A6A6ZCB2_9PLEO|nr:NAD(P)-binding protein [Ophiobolus disseminans]